jgi:uncharacterized protein (DUF1501 family)
MNRRQSVVRIAQLAGAGALAASHVRLFAAPPAPAKFLLVFLRGGYDANNVLVPTASDFYYEARPNIAIARADALPLDDRWGLHPALRDNLLPMVQRGELAFVPFAGVHDLSRSHFETQDRIELGLAQDGRDFNSGFLNRLAGELNGRHAIAFTDQLPLAMRGERQIANAALRSIGKPALDERQTRLVAAMYAGTRLQAKVNEGFQTRDDVARELAGEMDAAGRGAISTRGFELEARRVGRLLRERYDLGFIDVGGWDTHVGQGGINGYLANRLAELGGGLAGLAEELGPRWRDTVVVVVSEFGRTFRENGNRGTDHGHGSVYWVLGGAVRGGRVAGEQAELCANTLHQNRDMPVLNEYRALLGGVFTRMYGLNATAVARVFPRTEGRDLGLL